MSDEKQQQQLQLYQYSVKIEMTAKGLAMPTIHVYSNDMELVRQQAVEQYAKTIEELKARGLPVAAPDIKVWTIIVLNIEVSIMTHNIVNWRIIIR